MNDLPHSTVGIHRWSATRPLNDRRWLPLGAAAIALLSCVGCAPSIRVLPQEFALVGVHEERFLCIVMRESAAEPANEPDRSETPHVCASQSEPIDWASISQPMDEIAGAAQELQRQSIRLTLVAPLEPADRPAAEHVLRQLQDAGLSAARANRIGAE